MRALTYAQLVATAVFGSALALADDTIKIGVIQPLTGSVAYNGAADINGSKLAVEERNKAGGVLGKPIELVIEDGQCSPANSVNAAEKLIQKDKVVALSGAFCSSATAAIMPVAQKYKLPLLTGVSSKADLTEKNNPYFFRSAETDALLAQAFAKILAENLKLKKVAYIGVNDDWGRGGVEEFSKDLSAHGIETAMTEYFDHGATDFYTLLAKLRTSGADGVFIAAETQDGSILVKQLKEFGIDMKVFGVGSWATADFINLVGDAAEGIYAAVPYAATLPGERNQTFVQAYQAQYKQAPDKYAAAGYNATNILMDAIQRAGSTDAEQIREALKATNYQAPNGHYQFTANGQAYGFNAALVQIENKQPKVIATTSVEAPMALAAKGE
ncbi:amino acid/amide ABC transporter substrate-binding protein (HAAT family) [Pseudomonas duriflava]|uniref:Amino acid/amide ABC transporter substrate-binding protein (HAAT family) n=1 Tax=Pseudomonas duriflava TaxID=459528 RepID=A0A562QJ57_9PSED|nr:ABC transporter substrate-binding protein [Pseudomonas duriflava]TWI56771.1 amino acid/amide ABC transporter substrate-binding protein (HAAT family) [Pseudomonas duriflava]